MKDLVKENEKHQPQKEPTFSGIEFKDTINNHQMPANIPDKTKENQRPNDAKNTLPAENNPAAEPLKEKTAKK